SSLLSSNNPATTHLYTLSLHDALPISTSSISASERSWPIASGVIVPGRTTVSFSGRTGSASGSSSSSARACSSALTSTNSSSLRSEEHTSELQSPYDLVCRLLLEKKKQ